MWPSVSTLSPEVDSDITPLMDRCRQIVRYVKSHKGTKEAFHVDQKKVYETYIRERKVAKINFDLDVVNYNTKMEAFRTHTYPNLHIVAASLFSVRISSAASERLFSLAGLIRTARRNKMSAELFDALICYSYNDLMLQRQREQSQQRRTRRRNVVA